MRSAPNLRAYHFNFFPAFFPFCQNRLTSLNFPVYTFRNLLALGLLPQLVLAAGVKRSDPVPLGKINPMDENTKIYDFAASLGALEGYVYGKRHIQELDLDALENWSTNIVTAYRCFPEEVRLTFQEQCHQTAGRAIRSIEPLLGVDHPITQRLYALITQDRPLPVSADAFSKKKWFVHES